MSNVTVVPPSSWESPGEHGYSSTGVLLGPGGDMRAALALLSFVIATALTALAGCGHLVATIERPTRVAAAGSVATVVTAPPPGPLQTFQAFAPASLRVHPSGLGVRSGSRHALAVEARDDAGGIVGGAPTLVSLTPLTLRVGEDGAVEALAPGRGELAVLAGGAAAVVVVDVAAALPARRPGEVRIAGPTAMTVDAFGPLPAPLALEADRLGPARWVSSDPSVATVDAEGRVTAKADGTATISAELDGARADGFVVTVRQRPFLTTTMAADGARALRLAPGEAAKVAATVLDGNRNAVPVDRWRVDAPGVATVSTAGEVRGAAVGQTLVRPVARGLAAPDRAAIALGVGQAPATPAAGAGAIAAEPARLELPHGGAHVLRARIRDGAGAVVEPALTWTAEPPGVVAVDAQGRVTALAAGRATVKVEGAGLSRAVPVTVAAPADGLAPLALPRSLVFTSLGPAGAPLAAGAPGVAWETSDPAVVAVDDQGRLTAVADGRATVTAVHGTTRTPVAIEVGQQPAFLAVHGTLPGDPREVTVHGADVALAFSGTAFDFNGNAMKVDRLASDDDRVVFAGERDVKVRGGGSSYVRAICKGVRSANANSVLIQAAAAPVDPPNDGNAGGPTQPAAVSDRLRLDVPQNAIGLAVGGTFALGVTVRDVRGNAVGTLPDYTTDDPAVATVDANGRVHAVGAGTTTIRIAVPDDTEAVTVTVSQPANPNLIVNPVSLTTAAFGVLATPLSATTNQGVVAWSTDNAAVATVSAAGVVTAVGNGTANIIATAGTETTQVPITVDQRASFVRVDSDQAGNPRTFTLLTGASAQLSGTVRDANGNAMGVLSFEVAPGDAGVLAVDGAGVLTAVGPGTAFVRATTRGPVTSADGESIRVTVEARDLDVTPGNVSFDSLEETVALAATTNQGAITWTTDDAAVATVDGNGNVTAHADGTATITAEAGTSRVDVAVTVAQRASDVLVSSSLAGDPRNIVFNRVGDTLTLTATATDANNRNVPIIGWVSSDPAVVSVDANGNVTILADGTAFIRVVTNGNVSSADDESIEFTVDVNNAGSVDATINLP